jgi:hypothetical protein
MRNNLFRYAVRLAASAICIGAAINGAGGGSFTRACAVRDLHLLMLIEERQSWNAISAEKLHDAIFGLLNARMICHGGQVAEAMALYDSIGQDIASAALPLGRDHHIGR